MAGTELEYITKIELDILLRGGIPMERVRRSRPSAKRLIIRSIFEKWIVFYSAFMREDIAKAPTNRKGLDSFISNIEEASDRQVLVRMNSGDCGTTAIAVGQALEKLGFEIVYWDNGNHGYIEIDGLFYDALTLTGQPDQTKMYGHSEALNSGNLEFMHGAWLRVDPLGVLMVETFVRMLCIQYEYPFTAQE